MRVSARVEDGEIACRAFSYAPFASHVVPRSWRYVKTGPKPPWKPPGGRGKADISQTTPPSTRNPPSHTHSQFSQFQRLSTELQIMIWKETVTPQVLIALQFWFIDWNQLPPKSTPFFLLYPRGKKPPTFRDITLFHICKQTRELAILWYCLAAPKTGILFNPEIDVVHIGRVEQNHHPSDQNQGGFRNVTASPHWKRGYKHIETLRIDGTRVLDGRKGGVFVQRHFTGVHRALRRSSQNITPWTFANPGMYAVYDPGLFHHVHITRALVDWGQLERFLITEVRPALAGNSGLDPALEVLLVQKSFQWWKMATPNAKEVVISVVGNYGYAACLSSKQVTGLVELLQKLVRIVYCTTVSDVNMGWDAKTMIVFDRSDEKSLARYLGVSPAMFSGQCGLLGSLTDG
ncbi:hypothetical protein B0J13DRAFT_553097 [Dactylonectria estremocensis]|uniref:2EXR domain-containing protein n=1 Tax=Dactylonectria estremocensis TaxID=1079267 RepID=A0A9P9J324_9HYPO|nr:hypothetical protein B0J13DRAFT_553097 [Dactylonectria estremocensis]